MIDVSTNFNAAGKLLKELQKQLAFAQSRAAGITVQAGRDAANKSALAQFDNPIPAIFDKGTRRGWIAVRWDNKDVALRRGKATGHVQVRGAGRGAKELKAQQAIAHRNIFGGTVRNTPIALP